MKVRLLYLLLFLLPSSFCFGQDCPLDDVQFTTQAAVNQFLIDYPNCTMLPGDLYLTDATDLTDLSAFNNITVIQGNILIQNCEILEHLEGLNNLVEIEGALGIYDNFSLSSLDGLDALTKVGGDLDIWDNQQLGNIEALSMLTDIGLGSQGRLSIRNNDELLSLVGLSNISILNDVRIENNDFLLDMQGLSPAAVRSLGIVNNERLVNLEGLESLISIEFSLLVSLNPSLLSLSGLDNLMETDQLLISDNPRIKSMNGLENLEAITNKLRIDFNDSLQNLVGLQNVNTFFLEDLDIYDNRQLSFCGLPNICSYLATSKPRSILNNAPGCEDEEDVIINCNNLRYINFPVFFDLNQNGVLDEIEPFIPSVSLQLLPNDVRVFSNASNGGIVYLPNGDYTISYLEDSFLGWALTTDSSTYHVQLSDNNLADTVYFGLYPEAFLSGVKSELIYDYLRCNEIAQLKLVTYNTGTSITSGISWLQIDSLITDVNFINSPDTLLNPYLMGWEFDSLFPGQVLCHELSFTVPGPPELIIGDSLLTQTFTDYLDENGFQTTDTITLNQVVECAYDPNDKLVQPSRPEGYTLFDEALRYTIRFQNTGNAPAIDVQIRDTLDANLAANSFRYISSSHADVLNVSIEEENIVVFDFQDIFLPDSTSNFAGSQGYVSFSIHVKENLPEFTTIQNRAGIYFDYNPPIITNTTQNLMVSTFDFDGDGSSLFEDCDDMNPNVYPMAVEIPNNGIDEDCDGTDLTTSIENITAFPFQVFPNPNDGVLNIVSPKGTPVQVTLMTLTGKQLIQKEIHQNGILDLSTYPAACYFLHLFDGNRSYQQRIIKN